MPESYETLQGFAQKYLRKTYEELPDYEKRIIEGLIRPFRISRDTNKAFEDKLTFGQRVADRVASFGGSWTFIIIFAVILVAWVVLNSVVLASSGKSFDPFPYILLNLFLSMIAAMQAPIIMMSQNRQAAKDRFDAMQDYQVNLKSEVEITHLHDKIDKLSEQQWQELVEMQQKQIELLLKIVEQNTRGTAT